VAKPKHELEEFMSQVSSEIAAEYERIHARAREDPGTAGDEGEELWREVLSRWLPPAFPVVTKGRILSTDGAASPQVDLLVLHPGYPKGLLSKKYYLAAGVVAAFECKLTLRRRDLKKIGETAAAVRAVALTDPSVSPSVRSTLVSPIAFGVLAQSSEWSDGFSWQQGLEAELARQRVDDALMTVVSDQVQPRDSLEVVCIADLVCHARFTAVLPGPPYIPEDVWEASCKAYGWPRDGVVEDQLTRMSPILFKDQPAPNPLFVLLGKLLRLLANDFPEHERLSRYWTLADIPGGTGGAGTVRRWTLDVFPDDVRQQVRMGRLGAEPEWRMGYP